MVVGDAAHGRELVGRTHTPQQEKKRAKSVKKRPENSVQDVENAVLKISFEIFMVSLKCDLGKVKV